MKAKPSPRGKTRKKKVVEKAPKRASQKAPKKALAKAPSKAPAKTVSKASEKAPSKAPEKAPSKAPAPAPANTTTMLATATSVEVVRADDVALAEALRRGREVVDNAEGLVATYGQWLFANLFTEDTAAVLEPEVENPTWKALLEQAESSKLPLGRSTLRNAVRVAAFDKRLDDGAWNRLRFSHKIELLPLADPKTMRAAARHVLAGSLSITQVRTYVATLLHPEGHTPDSRLPVRAEPSQSSQAVSVLRAPWRSSVRASRSFPTSAKKK